MSDEHLPRTTLVVAIGANGVIGRDGQMPWPRTGDQVQFKELTWGHPLVMGRATYDSIGRPLPGRTSIVLTRDQSWDPGHADVRVVHDLDAALRVAHELDHDAFIIGGAQVYAAAREAGVVDRLVVTHVAQAPEGDAWFAPIDDPWRPVAREQYDGYEIVTYERPRG
ncbi:dihydrofolate reductase [Aeromicrobium sp. YIM 150415]|uniref:dihydrofolate reductase n=1 Tax=Aeromicrobium sp. YIM 150415 TaxID=2803912 RepID=UPI001964998F|nr:dihydrofolate reductase [Aeromicrobium sp. YIM 150415]MBM9462719.1 dihydrofolate reductase [Aeromicrobium sp. YIM 150415]